MVLWKKKTKIFKKKWKQKIKEIELKKIILLDYHTKHYKKHSEIKWAKPLLINKILVKIDDKNSYNFESRQQQQQL